MAQDTFELSSKLQKGVMNKEIQAVKNDLRIYKASNVKASISPTYAKYIGSTVTIAHNGNFRKFPVDGTTFVCSAGHYSALQKYLNHINRQIKIANNNTQFLGVPVKGDFRNI